MELENILFVLVHDAWHGAWAWEGVIDWLNQRGGQAVALDLPGHGAQYQPEETPGDYSLVKYAEAVEQFIRKQPVPAKNIVLVGHGTAGPVLQLVGERMAGELGELIFVAGYILGKGETIAEQMPPEMSEVMQQLAESRPDRRIAMELLSDYWRFNVMSDDARQAETALARLIPEPSAPFFEPITLRLTSVSAVPSAYISFNEDMSLPPGAFHPRMAGKLGPHRHVMLNAGHEGIITKPREVAEALIFLSRSV